MENETLNSYLVTVSDCDGKIYKFVKKSILSLDDMLYDWCYDYELTHDRYVEDIEEMIDYCSHLCNTQF